MTLLALAAGWFIGAGLVAYGGAQWWAGPLGTAIAVPWAAKRWQWWGGLLALAATASALAGGVRASGWLEGDPPELVHYRGARITVEGVVRADPDYGTTTRRYVVWVDSLHAPEARTVDGGILAIVPQYTELAAGERVRLTGTLEAPRSSPDFDYGRYLLRRGIVGEMYRPRVESLGKREGARWTLAADARRHLERGLGRALPEPEASLAAGILVGRDEAMSPELRQQFRRSGLAHLVAVSGSNVALVSAAAFVLFVPLVGRRRAVVPAAAMAVAYATVAGGDPPVVRATIMAGIFLLGLAIGRPQAGLPALGIAAVAMTAAEPRLLFDVGFQLSCAATAGLIAWYPWVDNLFKRALRLARLGWAVPRPVRSIAALTLSATLATAPIGWAAFGTASMVGPLANLVAQPLFVPAFLCSAVAAGAALLWSPSGWALGLAAYLPLHGITMTAEGLGGQPWASVNLPPPSDVTMVGIVAVGIALGWVALRRRPSPASSDVPVRMRQWQPVVRRVMVGTVTGTFLALIVGSIAREAPGPGSLRVVFFDVGQGDAILVTTPHGYDVLVDCGPSGLVLLQELGATLPPWDRTLDHLLVTHPQADHVGGCPALEGRYVIREGVAWNGQEASVDAWRRLTEQHVVRHVVAAGDEWSIDDVTFRVLWPPKGVEFNDPNEASLVIEIAYGRTRVLLTGDIEREAQAQLAPSVGAVDVLKVPHHGSANSRPSFFAAASPKVAVVSVGENNRYGHPAEETLQALVRAGATVVRTDERGRIVVRSDGDEVTVEAER